MTFESLGNLGHVFTVEHPRRMFLGRNLLQTPGWPLFLKTGATFNSAPECPVLIRRRLTSLWRTCAFGGQKKTASYQQLWWGDSCEATQVPRSITGICHRTHTQQGLQPQAAVVADWTVVWIQRLKTLRYLASLWRSHSGLVTSGRKESWLAGHPGVKKSLEGLWKQWVWPSRALPLLPS